MSEIDKLVNQAFPDELRRVEPVDVDESAILALTLEKLGLEQLTETDAKGQADAPAQSPAGRHMRQPSRRRAKPGDARRPRRQRLVSEPRLVEVPPEPERRFGWVKYVGWAVAACLTVAVAVRFGPALLENVGFGTGTRVMNPRAAGGDVSGGIRIVMDSEEALGKSVVEFQAGTEDTANPQVPIGDTDEYVRILAVSPNDADGFIVDLALDGMTSAEVGRYEFIATSEDNTEILPSTGRANYTGEAQAMFSMPQSGDNMVNLFVFKLAADDSGKFQYELVRTFTLFIESGDSYPLDGSFDPYELYELGIYPGSDKYNSANSFASSAIDWGLKWKQSGQASYDSDGPADYEGLVADG